MRGAVRGLADTTLFNLELLLMAMGRGKASGADRRFVVIWWAYQRPYYAVTRDESEAAWTANLRNGVVVEVEGASVSVKRVVDHWRRDEGGNPIPAEIREPAGSLAPAIARRVRKPR